MKASNLSTGTRNSLEEAGHPVDVHERDESCRMPEVLEHLHGCELSMRDGVHGLQTV